MPRILLAGSSERISFVAGALSQFQVFQAQNIQQAKHLLDELEFDAILCSTHFDDAKMFDLLKLIRDEQVATQTKFICLAESSRIPARVMQDSISIATRYLGASACLALESYGLDDASKVAIQHDVTTIINTV